MNERDFQTVQTYDDSAEALATYFAGIGSRVNDIELALKLAGNPPEPNVAEVGCGDGRDAMDIVPRVSSYVGFDPSEKALELARRRLPGVRFVNGDALHSDYPENLDVVYAFASLLHVSKENSPAVYDRIAQALRVGGILFLWLKEREKYEEDLVQDEFGERTFYYYTAPLVRELAGDGFEVALEDHRKLNRKTSNWLIMALRKVG
jgi:SAM-dependent methyltransferase